MDARQKSDEKMPAYKMYKCEKDSLAFACFF